LPLATTIAPQLIPSSLQGKRSLVDLVVSRWLTLFDTAMKRPHSASQHALKKAKKLAYRPTVASISELISQLFERQSCSPKTRPAFNDELSELMRHPRASYMKPCLVPQGRTNGFSLL
jgi:hypothetical protein